MDTTDEKNTATDSELTISPGLEVCLRETVAWTIGYLALCLVFVGMPLLSGRPFLIGDVESFYYPQLVFFGDSIRAGEFPLWNPLMFCGVPFAAEPRSAVFHVPVWIFALTNSAHAIWALLISSLVIAGLGTALLCRTAVRCAPFAALCGGCVFAFSGYFSQKLEHFDNLFTCPWTPWIFWAALRWLRAPSNTRFAMLAVLYCIQFLGGGAESCAQMTLFLAVFIVVWACCHHHTNTARVRQISLGAAGLCLGVGLGAFQIVPVLELLTYATRARGFDLTTAARESMPLWKPFAEILAPSYWGSSVADGVHRSLAVPTQYSGYFGLAAAILAVWHVTTNRANRAVIGWSIFGLFGLLLAFGSHTPVYRLLYYAGFKKFLHASYFIYLSILAVSVLTAGGIQQLLERPIAVSSRSKTLAMIAGIAAAAGLPGLLFIGEGCWPSVNAAMTRNLMVDGLVAVFAVSLLWLAIAVSNPRHRRALILLAVYVPLLVFTRNAPLGRLEDSRLADSSYVHEWKQASIELGTRYRVFNNHCSDMRSQRTMMLGLHEVWGYESGLLPLRRYEELKQRMGPDTHLARTPGRRLLDLLGAKYQFHNKDPKDSLLTTVSNPADCLVMENRFARPRLSFVRQAIYLDDEDTLGFIANGPWDPAEQVLLDPIFFDDTNSDSPGTWRTEIIEESNNRVHCSVVTDRKGFLLLNDAYYPGWEARVNGNPTTVLRANYLFRAVPVAAGTHEVEFVFKPHGLTAGCAISACSLLIALLLVFRRERNAHTSSGSHQSLNGNSHSSFSSSPNPGASDGTR